MNRGNRGRHPQPSFSGRQQFQQYAEAYPQQSFSGLPPPQQQFYSQSSFGPPSSRGSSRGSKKQFPKDRRSSKMPVDPPPPQHLSSTPTEPDNRSLFKETLFCTDVTISQETPRTPVSGTYSSFVPLMDLVYERYVNMHSTFSRTLTLPAFRYYCSSIFWLRMVRLKQYAAQTPLTPVEYQILNSTATSKFEVPDPIFTYLQAFGLIESDTQLVYITKAPTYPAHRGYRINIGGFWSDALITANTHNYYEEYPTIGVFARALQYSLNNQPGDWDLPIVPADATPTLNLLGYMPMTAERPEAFALIRRAGITENLFPEQINNTGLNLTILSAISTILSTQSAFKTRSVAIANMQLTGVSAFLTRNICVSFPGVHFYPNGTFTHHAVSKINQLAYGIAAAFLFQQEKEPYIDAEGLTDDTTWCCIGPDAVIPAAWVDNRNDLRDLPQELVPMPTRTVALDATERRRLVVDGLLNSGAS